MKHLEGKRGNVSSAHAIVPGLCLEFIPAGSSYVQAINKHNKQRSPWTKDVSEYDRFLVDVGGGRCYTPKVNAFCPNHDRVIEPIFTQREIRGVRKYLIPPLRVSCCSGAVLSSG